MLTFADSSVVGTSTLVRTDNGLNMHLSTTGLEPGAYTNWWIMFQHPEDCGAGPGFCGGDPNDFTPGGPAQFGFGFAAGHVVGPTGEARFASHLSEGTVLMDDNLDPVVVFEDARSAEIHLIVRHHGPADPGRIPEQIHTGEFDTLGPDADVQFSVHPAPAAAGIVASAVPEPSGILIAVAGACVLAGSGRRRMRRGGRGNRIGNRSRLRPHKLRPHVSSTGQVRNPAKTSRRSGR